jgi:hypothetical protein
MHIVTRKKSYIQIVWVSYKLINFLKGVIFNINVEVMPISS